VALDFSPRARYAWRVSKNEYPPPQCVPITTNATTFGPQAVTAITPSWAYQSKTAALVATRVNGKLKLSVFRASTTASGLYSRDDFERGASGRLALTGKADQKFLRPEIPEGAKLINLDGQDVYTMHEMTSEEIAALRAELPELLRR
jgi:hypothetical protein